MPDCTGWVFEAGLCKAHFSASKPSTGTSPAKAASPPPAKSASTTSSGGGAAAHGSPPAPVSVKYSTSLVPEAVSPSLHQKSAVKSSPAHVSAGGAAIPGPSAGGQTIPSAFDISQTSVSRLHNWLAVIPDVPLRQALEQLLPYCPGLSSGMLADMIESNGSEVATITVHGFVDQDLKLAIRMFTVEEPFPIYAWFNEPFFNKVTVAKCIVLVLL